MTTATLERPIALEVGPDYNPRLDPGFKSVWLNTLIRHPDTWLHPSEVFASDDAWTRSLILHVAYETVVAARDAGHVIAGDRALGYCWRRCEIPRYKHHERDAEDEPGPLPGQLSMDEPRGV